MHIYTYELKLHTLFKTNVSKLRVEVDEKTVKIADGSLHTKQ